MILANDLPPIEPYDEPTQKRARVYSMTKPFVDEPSNEFELKKDYNLEAEMKTIQFQKAFIQLLIELYAEFQSNGRIEVEPQEVLNAKSEWLGDDEENNIFVKFQNVFEITNDERDFVGSEDITNWTIRDKEMSYKNFAQQLKKYCIINDFGNVELKNKKINKKVIKTWFGTKLIIEREDDIDGEVAGSG